MKLNLDRLTKGLSSQTLTSVVSTYEEIKSEEIKSEEMKEDD